LLKNDRIPKEYMDRIHEVDPEFGTGV
jgi:hypothetical protein